MSETRICANCSGENPIDQMFEVEGDWLCEDCADRLTVICDRCAERVYEENAVEDDTHTLCDHCFDEYYVRCDDCGRIIHRDRAYWDDDDNAYCASCWDEHCEVIHEYSYTPDLVFHGKACVISALSLKSTTAVRLTAMRRSCSTSRTRMLKISTSRQTAVWMKGWNSSPTR